jgi:hypothetical protein
VAANYEVLTDEAGQYSLDLPVDGDYNIFVSGEGFEPSFLVAGQDVEVVKGEFKTPDVVLKKKGEIDPPTDSAEAYVYGKGVTKDQVWEVLMSHGIISSADEINEPEEDTITGKGWTTYVRDGQSISDQPIDYVDEPFWKVTFKEERADGLKIVYVQRKCGNITVPPGEEVITPTPGHTPTPVPSPTPSATPTPTPTATPRPTPTPTPVPPAPSFICPDFKAHGDLLPGDIFTRVGTVQATNNVTWSWTVTPGYHLSVLLNNSRKLTLQVQEGAHLVVEATDAFGRTFEACVRDIPVSEKDPTPAPTRTPAPVPSPPPGPEPTPEQEPDPP